MGEIFFLKISYGDLFQTSFFNVLYKVKVIVVSTFRLVPDLFFYNVLYKVKAIVVSTLVLIYFGRPQLGHTIKTNCITFQAVDQMICSNLRFYKRDWDYFLHHILCMIYQKIYLSCYISLTDQISLSDCLYYWRY